MARLPYVDPSDASEEVRQALERAPALNISRMMAGGVRRIGRLGDLVCDEVAF
jgi:hypothetical protein